MIRRKLSHTMLGLSRRCSNSPLGGVTVLDLTRIVAGPYCTMLLGDLGARVIKAEHPNGDEARKWGPPFIADTSESCYFISLNRNKKSICVNIKHPRGAQVLRELATKSDILVENFIPGKLDEFGLGYEQLREVAPHLIYCSITGYGPDGPYAQRPGYDVIAAGVGGLMSITGEENGEPVKVGVAVTDIATGLHAYGSIMAAMLLKHRTGKGQKIDCNLLSTQVASLINLGSNYLNAGEIPIRYGTAHASIVPYQAFSTKDGHLIVGTGSDKQFQSLCSILKTTSPPPVAVLTLRKPKAQKKVEWSTDTVDNENMNKKKSKCCCIFKKKREFGESDSEDDADECDNCSGHVEKKKLAKSPPQFKESG